MLQTKNSHFILQKKKISTVDDYGKTITPIQNNGWKLEMFIFDVFAYSENLLVFQVERKEEFSPLKNHSGVDCPETCRKHLSQFHRQLIENAGGTFVEKDKSNGEQFCEISPLISYAGEGLYELVNGKSFTLPFHLTK